MGRDEEEGEKKSKQVKNEEERRTFKDRREFRP